MSKSHPGVDKERMRRNLMFRTMQQWEQLPVDPRWQERARCRPGSGYDPEIFSPESGSAGIAVVRLICAECPVRPECFVAAMAQGRECLGVWGGYTETERRSYRTWLAAQQRKAARERAEVET